MSYSPGLVGSRIVDVVINSQLSRAVLGKRKASGTCTASNKSILDQWSDDDSEDSDYSSGRDEGLRDLEEDSDEQAPPSGSVTPKERRYRCTHDGCRKAYTKPSRLAEHMRSHTGERPYVCTTCSKSYLREAHLQAHTRSHLPPSARPHVCSEGACEKRFWTTQHLRVHIARVHQGEKAFVCTEGNCGEAFVKHNQLRRHFAEAHSPPGTKPFRCDAENCAKSFATIQKLRKHSKVHQDNRYACIDAKCTADGASPYFPTWTALRAHMRACHPPTCPYPHCEGRVFASHTGLKEHLKVHRQREIEDALEHAAGGDERPAKRRRGGEVGRDWACEIDDCEKAFKSKKALTTHHNIAHLGRRDHACTHTGCSATFGYKHLLQRHTAKVHSPSPAAAAAVVVRSDAAEADDGVAPYSVEWVTGQDYGSHRSTRRPLVRCPWPDHFEEDDADAEDESRNKNEEGEAHCAYVFSRAYDLRRHLKAVHALVLDKEEVDVWVENWRARHSQDSA